jgi:alpha-glucosidase
VPATGRRAHEGVRPAVVERESYMAKTAGTREFPWRVLVVAAADTTLLDTDIVYRLASESRIGDTSWIRPGKVAWDWWMVNYYERVAREAARRHLLVDFHGAYKPTGLYRTYPDVITSEGVLGLEQSESGDQASPDNAVTFPFMRMMAGPVDYTPGAMLNATKADFEPVFNRPTSQGTRCQQLAMYVVYESPLQMLADSPSNYRREAESLAFLAGVPTEWDETKVLSAAIGEHILVARRSGTVWYVGAMTNWSARDLEVPLSFLGDRVWEADIFKDGPNADRAAADYAREKRAVGPSDRLRIHLAPGGGFVIRLTKK